MNALDDFTRKCSLWRDEFLLEELDKGPAGYAHLEYFAVIQAEAVRRGLPLSPTPLVLGAPAPPPQGSLVRRLWRGEVDLVHRGRCVHCTAGNAGQYRGRRSLFAHHDRLLFDRRFLFFGPAHRYALVVAFRDVAPAT